MRLAVTVDVVAIAASIPIILAIADDCSDRAAEDAANGRAGPYTKPAKSSASQRAGACADRRSGRASGNDMISIRVACATSERQAARHSG